MNRQISIIMPVYNEGENVVRCLDDIIRSVTVPFHILVVHDSADDTTVPVLERYDSTTVRPVLNTYGPGPANAIRFGMDSATGDVVVVTMADGSDDASQIPLLAEIARSGTAIVAASRYMKGGRQVGGPRIKKSLSRLAGLSLFHLARVGTHDATNSFKAYQTEFLQRTEVESTAGFEIAIELVAKARRYREPVTEIPTVWTERSDGESRFRVAKWIPMYAHWYFFAFGPRLRRSVSVTKGAK